MPFFRYYCLDEDGKIAHGEHVELPSLQAAIHAAYDNCTSHQWGPYHKVEVWQKAECLYSSKRKTSA
jgi:hypothetical protein